MEQALLALNALVANGVITDYAIGGAVGATFYLEAVQTEDLDAFVFLPVPATGILLLTPIYEALIARGGIPEREYVRFEDWPVQILPNSNTLITEAIEKAESVFFGGIPTRVFTAEHLVAVAVQTGRRKDQLRVGMFLEWGGLDMVALRILLTRYSLLEKFDRWRAVESSEND